MEMKDLKIWILYLALCCMLTPIYVTAYPLSPLPGREHTPLGSKCPYKCMCQNKQIFCNGVMLRSVPLDIPIPTVYLNLRGNIIKQLSMNSTFPKLENLQGLLLGGNKIAHIDDGVLMKMRQLMMLDLSKNSLVKVTANTFHGARYLWTLSLATNHLEKIGDALEDLRALSILNLANNKLIAINENDFKRNTKLKLLDLSKNKISFIHPSAFKDLPNLQYLLLKYNPLVGMSYLRFGANSKLALADFTNCGLRLIIGGLPRSVKELRYSKNNLTSVVATDFMPNSTLEKLNINENQVVWIDGDVFSRLPRLEELWLNKNRLINVPTNISASIEGVHLEYNRIQNLGHGNFINNANLKFLNLQQNNITNICHGTFSGLTSLITLDLGANYISDVKKCSFENLTNLEKLDLSRNPIQKMGTECFEPLSKLRTLQMAHVPTNARLYPDIFRGVRNLQYLDLYNSPSIAQGIVKSADYLDTLYSVRDLNLMYDGLQTLPEFFPSYFPNIQVVKLSGNPWRCDANILTLRNWIRNQTNVNFYLGNEIQCMTPEWMQGKAIYDVDENVDFDEEKNTLPDDYYYYDEEDFKEAMAEKDKKDYETNSQDKAEEVTSTASDREITLITQTESPHNGITHTDATENEITEPNDFKENQTEVIPTSTIHHDADNIMRNEVITEQPIVNPRRVNGKDILEIDTNKAETIEREDGQVEKKTSFRINGFKVIVKTSDSDTVKLLKQDKNNRQQIVASIDSSSEKKTEHYEKAEQKISNKVTRNNFTEKGTSNVRIKTRPKAPIVNKPKVAIKVGIKVTPRRKMPRTNVNSVGYRNDAVNRYGDKANNRITTAPTRTTMITTPTTRKKPNTNINSYAQYSSNRDRYRYMYVNYKKRQQHQAPRITTRATSTTTTSRTTTQLTTTPRTLVTPKTITIANDRVQSGDNDDIEFIEENNQTTVPHEKTNYDNTNNAKNHNKGQKHKVDDGSATAQNDFDAEPGESEEYSGAGYL